MTDLTHTLSPPTARDAGIDADASSWGRYPGHPQERHRLWWPLDPVPWSSRGGVLPRGLGRSYGDSCLAHGGTLVDVTPCARLLELDTDAGLMTADSGQLTVVGYDPARQPQQIQDRIGYMPQRFGLYEDLSVEENLNLYADLNGVTRAERKQRYPQLLEMTALGPFGKRLAGRLSGGMKQKLGLACTLVRSPELLLLDEPTVGVDPLSRRELWAILTQLVREQGLTVLVSTSYLDEADHCAHAIVLHQGRVLAEDSPTAISRLAAGRTFLIQPVPG